MVYIINFMITTFLVTACKRIKNNSVYICSILLSVLIVALLAGFRSFDVGTDSVYLKGMYFSAIQSNSYQDYLNDSFFFLWRYWQVSEYEYGFTFVVYIASKIFGSPFGPRFIVQLIMYLPIIYILYKERKNISCSIFIFVYLFLFYNVSLNIMRQFDALSLYLLAIYFFVKKHRFKSLFWICVAYLFHNSVILPYLIVVLIYRFINYKYTFIKSRYTLYKNCKTGFVILCIIMGVLMSDSLILILRNLNYEFTGYIGNGFGISYRNLILRLPILIYLFIFRKEVKGKEFDFNFYLIIFLIDLTINNFAINNQNAGRIGYFFSIFYCLMYSTSCKNLFKSKSIKKIINYGFIITYCSSYFVYYILICNSSVTLPYVFDF